MDFRAFAKKIIKPQLDFSKIQKRHRVQSLALQKLNLTKILEYYRQIEIKYSFQSKKGKTWFQNQLRIFIWTVFNFSAYSNKKPIQFAASQWQTISSFFRKDSLTCQYFFYCTEKYRKSQWTAQEDKFIIEHINKPTFTNEWTEIGKQLFSISSGDKFKKPKQIRQRWNNYLNPNVLKDKWSSDEDLLLFRIVSKQGRKWALISKILKTRSEHSVKNRYTNLLKKFKSTYPQISKLRKSQVEAQFLRSSLKKLEQQKQNERDYNDKQWESQQQNASLHQYPEKLMHVIDETKQGEHKDMEFHEEQYQHSPQLEFIKSPIYYDEKQEDYMNTQALIKSFQPTFPHLF